MCVCARVCVCACVYVYVCSFTEDHNLSTFEIPFLMALLPIKNIFIASTENINLLAIFNVDKYFISI